MLAGPGSRGTWATPAPVRAAFFDIDGTLTEFATQSIIPSAKRAVEEMRDRGVRAFVATGRTPGYANEFVGGLFDGVISINGMHVALGDEVIFEKPLGREAVERLVEIALSGRRRVVFHELGRSYMSDGPDIDVDGVRLGRFFDIEDPRQALESEIYQAGLWLDPGDEKAFLEEVPGCAVSRWHPAFVDVFAAGGGKDVGIARALERLGMTTDEAVAFGDSPNDMSMFDACGTSVAMASGFDEAVAAATYITEPPGDDGIYNACVRLGII